MLTTSTPSDSLYAAHFGLNGEPFSAAPAPLDMQMTQTHAEAIAALEVGLRNRSGLIVLTGAPGTGKTSVVYHVLSALGSDVRSAYVANTSLGFDDLLRQVLADFDVTTTASSRSGLLDELNSFLRRCADDGVIAALVIDEAQNLSHETLEQIRLLTNYETFTHKLLQIVLVGSLELDTKLASPALEHLASRVAVHSSLSQLDRAESRAYLEHRLGVVGGSLEQFSPTAVRALLRAGNGNPRHLNILAQNAMLFAFGNNENIVSEPAVRAADHSLRSGGSRWSSLRRPSLRQLAAGVAGLALVMGLLALAVSHPASHPGPRLDLTPRFDTTLSVDSAASTRLEVEPHFPAPSTTSRDLGRDFAVAGLIVGPLGMVAALLLGVRSRQPAWGIA